MFSARMAAEELGIAHMTVALQPMMFLSAYDPPAVPQAPWLAPLLSKLGRDALNVSDRGLRHGLLAERFG